MNFNNYWYLFGLVLYYAILTKANESATNAVVDITNEFGACVLQALASPRANVVFSPYGLVSVMVLLKEGANSSSSSALQIERALKLPAHETNRNQLGFRDLHRYLKSYFTSDGFLRGLILSNPKAVLSSSYLKKLKYYGFEPDVSIETTTRALTTTVPPPKTTEVTTEIPETEVPSTLAPVDKNVTFVTPGPVEDLAGRMNTGVTFKEDEEDESTQSTTEYSESLETRTISPLTDSITTLPTVSTKRLPPRTFSGFKSTTTSPPTTYETTNPSTLIKKSTDPVELETASSVTSPIYTTVTEKLDTDEELGVRQFTKYTSPLVSTLPEITSTTKPIPKTTTVNVPVTTDKEFPATTESEYETDEDNIEILGRQYLKITPYNANRKPINETDTTTSSYYQDVEVTTEPLSYRDATTLPVLTVTEKELFNETTTTEDVHEVEEITDRLFVTTEGTSSLSDTLTTLRNKIKEFVVTNKPMVIDEETTILDKTEATKTKEAESLTFVNNFYSDWVTEESVSLEDLEARSLHTGYQTTVMKPTTKSIITTELPISSTFTDVTTLLPTTNVPLEIFDARRGKYLDTITELPLSKTATTFEDPTSKLTRPPDGIKMEEGLNITVRKLDEKKILKHNDYENDVEDLKSGLSFIRDLLAEEDRIQEKSSNLSDYTKFEIGDLSDLNEFQEQNEYEHKSMESDDDELGIDTDERFEAVIARLKEKINEKQRGKRKSRSINDLNYGLKNWIDSAQYRDPARQWFSTFSGEHLVPVLTVKAFLPYADLPGLDAEVLQIPLDVDYYTMLIVLPKRKMGIKSLLYSLQWCNLRSIVAALRTTPVNAVIPTFTLINHINLVNLLGKLGVTDIFNPRTADLSEMSNDPHLHVKSIEQVVTISVREHYNDNNQHRWYDATESQIQKSFMATQPFAFFVIDTETKVSLVAGAIVDPLLSS